MIDKEALADLLIDRLNEIAEHDPIALGKLIEARVACNNDLADHPAVQVQIREAGPAQVGVLGLLNGLVGVVDDGPRKGWGLITAVCENDGSLVRFRRTEGLA